MLRLVIQPVFVTLALIGNSIILIGAFAHYSLEHGLNPKVVTFLDSLWWSVATVTSVGYGDVSPVTPPGKVVGILMMLTGTTLFCSFTALFATALLAGQIEEVENEMKSIEVNVKRIEDEVTR